MGRCLAVWLLVTAGLLATLVALADDTASLASSAVWHGSFDDLLVAVASAAVLVCAAWSWLITTATVVDLVRGRVPTSVPRGLTRRLVLAACGAAVVAGISSPALAGSGAGDHSLAGLPMPDRAVATAPRAPVVDTPAAQPAPRAASRPAAAAASRRPAAITVRTGDSLWSIAADRLGPDAAVADIDAAWRDLYAANRDAIGPDPDLIRPGLDLEPGSN
ncbi:hypothetical protein CF8_1200 [Nocardioides sp. CF8]|nr:hypothetical protein CF8_1200 [Nocardioides sp. CF8]